MNFYQIIKNLVPRIVIIITIILVGLTLYFIYLRVWQVFSLSKDSLSEKDVIPVELKVDLFKKIDQQLEEKLDDQKIDFKNIKTPFAVVERESEENDQENEDQLIEEIIEEGIIEIR